MEVTHEEIDGFALEIEKTIQENRERIDELPDFEYGQNLRRAADDHIIELGEIDFDS